MIHALSLSVKLQPPEFTAVCYLSKVCTSEALLHFPETRQYAVNKQALPLKCTQEGQSLSPRREGVSPCFPLHSLLTPQALPSRPTLHTFFIVLATPLWSTATNSTPGILCFLILNPGYHFLTITCTPKHAPMYAHT